MKGIGVDVSLSAEGGHAWLCPLWGCALQAWKYRPWVQEFIDQQLERLAEQKQPTIGFHIRGGDKVFEDKFMVR